MPIPQRILPKPDRGAKNQDVSLERAKNIATIFSAIAIPIVLTIAGYLIQRQLADDSLKKDYVGIATGILKENPANQEPELRTWAVKVLDENSPVPFSKKAKESLFSGTGAGPAWIGPPEICRKLPGKRTFDQDLRKLVTEIESGNGTVEVLVEKMRSFIEKVTAQEDDVRHTRSNMECVLKWVDVMEQSDIDFRKAIGAPSSKSILEQLTKERAAASKSIASDSQFSPPLKPASK
jgi:hypothetical protein